FPWRNWGWGLISLDQWTPVQGQLLFFTRQQNLGSTDYGNCPQFAFATFTFVYNKFQGQHSTAYCSKLRRFYFENGATKSKKCGADTALHLAVKHGHYDIVVC
ncbi:hypothetical protein CFP56_030771, partial [Quercus suber]